MFDCEAFVDLHTWKQKYIKLEIIKQKQILSIHNYININHKLIKYSKIKNSVT